MFKLFIFAAIFAFAFAAPQPKAEPKPGLIAATYTAPHLAVAPAITYSSAYSAPLAYAGYVGSPYVNYPYAPNYLI